jgi:phosphoesterase RecJ-like protein
MSIFPKPATEAPADAPARPGANPAGEPASHSVRHSIDAILAVLRRGQRFLVCSHARPDGDAVGSMLAFGMLLEQMGKQADLVTADHIPAQYRGLPGVGSIRATQRPEGPYDAVILLECDGLERTQLCGLDQFFLVNIDHHISGHAYANLNWIDYEAASVGEMVYQLAKAAGATLTPQMAACLYTTVLTDTGGFCYGSVRASTFAWAQELVQAGADPIRLAQEVCFSIPLSKMLLLGVALDHLHHDGPLAWLWVTHEDMERTGALEEDCEGIVNFALGIAGIDAAAFLRELPDTRIRMSLRSKGSLSVADIAERLGGGGHQNAAGCTLDGPLERALAEILQQLRAALASNPH